MAFENLQQWETWLVIVIQILIMILVLYLSMRIITGRRRFTGGYFVRLLLVSILLVVVLVAVAGAIDLVITVAGIFGSMFYILITIGFILIIRYLLCIPNVVPSQSDEKFWQWSLWITVISIFFLLLLAFAVYFISDAITGNGIQFVPLF